MKSNKYLSQISIVTGLALALALTAFAPSARANVYASNIKVNGVLTGLATVGQGSGATITYILNEPASSGVTIKILSGATLVRSITISGGIAGTTRGLNTIVWDGKNNGNANVAPGNYTVSVSASSSGYLVWTQILTNTNAKVYWSSGIAVDTTTNSAYYGRVMVANGVTTALNVAPHPVGILKFNADGSEADEGQSAAGNPFVTDPYLSDSCRSLKYGTDDRVYYDDWTGSGRIIACDMIMSSNQVVLDSANFFGTASGGNWADIDVTDLGTTNAMAWFADGGYPSVGVWCWPLTNNGVADPTFEGINVLASGGAAIPLRSGYGMMIDTAGDIFLGEVRSNPTDTSVKLTCITNWQSASSLPIVSENIGWQDGAESDSVFRSVAAVAIDSRANPKYVSAAFSGSSGGLIIVNAADGTVVTNINQNLAVYYIGTCFDNVGNVYAGNANAATPWEVFSPPGANQATTPAVATIQVTVPMAISNIAVSGGTATIKFTGNPSDPASAFKLLSSGTVNGTYSLAAGAVITGSAGSYTATVAASSAAQFYRIERQ